MPKLTKQIVDAAKAPFTWDSELRGFGLRRSPAGVKSYILQYRTGGRGSQARRRTIGRHGVLTPEEARTRARRWLAEVADGSDPAAFRDAKQKGLTVAELCDLYLRDGPAEKPNKKASSWQTDTSNITRHIKPLLGRKPAAALTQAEVAKFQVDVAAGKSMADIKTRKQGRAIVSGGRGTAGRSLAVLGAVLTFAANRKLIAVNPAKGVPLLKLAPKERFLSEGEVAVLAATIAAMQAEGTLSRTAATAMRLLMVTGCRKNEILSLQWRWVNFDRGCLQLPDSKTGAKVVPLASVATDLLSALPRCSAFVLPAGKGQGHYTGLQKDWERVRLRAGLVDIRIHDLRHSFASFAVADGAPLYTIGKVLGHKQARTTEGYSHLRDDPLRAVAERTGKRISDAMNRGC
jgi:integrase